MCIRDSVKTFYEIALLDALSPNARVAALQHSDVLSMARAADAVVLESRAEAEASRAVNAISLEDDSTFYAAPPPLTPAPAPAVAAVRAPPAAPSKKELCATHARWGKKAFKCLSPASCRMRHITVPRPSPSPSPSAPGNGKAGGQ